MSTRIADVLAGHVPVGSKITVEGWIRTRRDSKGGFSFLELNDGSCFGNVQVIAEARLPNYESEIKHLPAGASVTVIGEVRKSPAQGQVIRKMHVARLRTARRDTCCRCAA